MSNDTAPASAPAEPVAADVPAWKLLAILGGGGAVAGMIIVAAYQWSKPTIDENKRRRLDAAVREVLKGPERCDSLWLVGGELTTTLPAGADEAATDRVFVGVRKDGSRAGFAIVAADFGFADEVKVIFGFDADAGKVLGFKVLGSKETPGLGDGIEKNEAFVKEFEGVATPITGVKKGSSRGAPDHEVDTITGATISSKTVIRIINTAAEKWQPKLRAYRGEGAR